MKLYFCLIFFFVLTTNKVFALAWNKVEDAHIAKIKYDRDSKKLTLEKHKSSKVFSWNGNRKEFDKIPTNVYIDLMSADNKYNYYVKNIKNKYTKKIL